MPADTRGILDPAEMMRLVAFDRVPAGEALEGIVEWCWSVAWDLPEGLTHDQEVLSHPAGNLSVGTADETGATHHPALARVRDALGELVDRRDPVLVAEARLTLRSRSASAATCTAQS